MDFNPKTFLHSPFLVSFSLLGIVAAITGWLGVHSGGPGEDFLMRFVDFSVVHHAFDV